MIQTEMLTAEYILNAIMSGESISQKEISDKSGISEVTISRYVNGKREPKFSDMVKIINALGYKFSIQKNEG